MHHRLTPVPIAEITTPTSHRIAIVNNYWLTKEGYVFKARLYGNYQFNAHRNVVELVYKKELADGYEITQLPIAFIEQRG